MTQNRDLLDLIPEKTIKVLDHGYVRLVDCMPRVLPEGELADTAIVDAARVSYQEGTQRKSTDKGLINYLVRHLHTSPLEQVSFKFEICMPMFIARQFIRHRTASLNEESARYSVLRDRFYKPTELRAQSDMNKQATLDEGFDPVLWPDESGVSATSEIDSMTDDSYSTYTELLKQGVAREQARIILPVSAYTSMVWKMDLHNLLHFLRLRMDSHAQYEIRVFANAIAEFVKVLCPWTWEAFQNYVVNSITFSGKELKVLQNMSVGMFIKEGWERDNGLDNGAEDLEREASGMSKGEWREFLAKLQQL